MRKLLLLSALAVMSLGAYNASAQTTVIVADQCRLPGNIAGCASAIALALANGVPVTDVAAAAAAGNAGTAGPAVAGQNNTALDTAYASAVGGTGPGAGPGGGTPG